MRSLDLALLGIFSAAFVSSCSSSQSQPYVRGTVLEAQAKDLQKQIQEKEAQDPWNIKNQTLPKRTLDIRRAKGEQDKIEVFKGRDKTYYDVEITSQGSFYKIHYEDLTNLKILRIVETKAWVFFAAAYKVEGCDTKTDLILLFQAEAKLVAPPSCAVTPVINYKNKDLQISYLEPDLLRRYKVENNEFVSSQRPRTKNSKDYQLNLKELAFEKVNYEVLRVNIMQ